MCHLPLPHISLSCGFPKGCVGARTTLPLHAVVLREFWIWSKMIFLRNLGWIGETERSHHSSYVYKNTRCYTCGTKSLRQCYDTGVVISSSTWPWGRLRWLHHQRLCGGIILAFGLQGYVTESPANRFSITNRYILGNSGCIANNFFVICIEPQQTFGKLWLSRRTVVCDLQGESTAVKGSHLLASSYRLGALK
jgi:hypothetical protein